MIGELRSVNLALVRSDAWAGDQKRTGIDKRPTAGRVRVHRLGLAGDTVVDGRHHGGVDQAVYAYAREDAERWAAELGRPLAAGSFGENLTTEGVDVTNAVIGERWAVGTTVLEVRRPRLPCRVFAGFWELPDLIKRFTARGLPGAYLGVVVEGELGAGDRIKVVHRPGHGRTLGMLFRARTTEPDLLAQFIDVAELSSEDRETVQRRLHVPAAQDG